MPRELKQETLAEIEEELRSGEYAPLADRIHAAWERERESLLTKHGENVNSGSVVYTGENNGGNAAEMREALELLNQLFDSCVLGTHSEMTADEMDKVDELYFKTKAAISAPARNCDLKECSTDDGMISAHERFCESWHDDGKTCAECPYNSRSRMTTCREKWLLATAAERKGDGDENN